jgi:hypothetical protein
MFKTEKPSSLRFVREEGFFMLFFSECSIGSYPREECENTGMAR